MIYTQAQAAGKKTMEALMDIGIIGGADGPTTIFVTSAVNWYAIAAIAFAIAAALALIIRAIIKRKR